PEHRVRDGGVHPRLGHGQRPPGICAGPLRLPGQEAHLRAARPGGLPARGLHRDPDLRPDRHPRTLREPVGHRPRRGRGRQRDRGAAVHRVLRPAAEGARGSRDDGRRRLPEDLRADLPPAGEARDRDRRDPPVHARMERLPAATGADAVPARPPHARCRDLQPAAPVLQRLGGAVRRFDDRAAADHRRVHRPPEILHRIILRRSERMTPAVPSTNPSPTSPDRPHVILVCVDQMRADAMGAAGNEHIDTPNLDDLARGGYHFTRAYSATPTCVPARVAMFTGKSPALHGRYGYREGVSFTDAYPVTMQSTLRENGYQTFAVGKMHVFPDRARCGFDEVLLHDGFLHTSRRLSRGPSAAIDDYVEFLRRETGDPRADYQETG